MRAKGKGNSSDPVGKYESNINVTKMTSPSRISACADLHKADDLDVDDKSHHHSLGWKHGQAAPGTKVLLKLKELEDRIAVLEGP